MKPAILLYDATCRFCTASSKRALSIARPGSLIAHDVNDPQMQARYGISPEDAQRELHLILPSGRVSSGAYGVRDVLRLSKWAWPLANLWRIPGFAWIAERVYAWVADHRYLFMGRTTREECADEACSAHLGRTIIPKSSQQT